MFNLVKGIYLWLGFVFIVIMLVVMYNMILGFCYFFVVCFIEFYSKKYYIFIIIMMVMVFILSFVGFVDLINVLYKFMGIVGLFIVVVVLIKYYKCKKDDEEYIV